MKDRVVLMGFFWFLTLMAYLILPFCSTKPEVTYLNPKLQEGEFIVSDAQEVSFYFLLFLILSTVTTLSVVIKIPSIIRTSFDEASLRTDKK